MSSARECACLLGVGAAGKSSLLPPARTLERIEVLVGVGHMHRGPWQGRSPMSLSQGVSSGSFCHGEVSGVHRPAQGTSPAHRASRSHGFLLTLQHFLVLQTGEGPSVF